MLATVVNTINGQSYMISLGIRLPSPLKNLHLTFRCSDGTISTFASDNARHLQGWWAVQCAKLLNPERDFWIVLVKREFTAQTDSHTGLPIKLVSSCFFSDQCTMKQSAAETKHAFTTDARTGASLPVPTDMLFVDF